MELKLVEDAHNFKKLAGGWLAVDEGVNAVALGVIDSMTSDKPRYEIAYWGVVVDGSEVVGTGIMTPPYPLNINASSIKTVPLFVEMAKRISRPKSVLGPGQFAKEFSKLWCDHVKCSIGSEEAQAIHRLEKVHFPETRGELVLATSEHQQLLNEWGIGFCKDCGMGEDIPEVQNHTIRAIEEKSRYILVVDNVPVSMAGRARETTNGGTINWVYTPPNQRKKGFASELVSKLSQTILDSGKKYVFLYTQLDNPTSNKIYHEVGFRVISESWHIRFDYTSGSDGS